VLDFVFDAVETDNFSGHKVVWVFFGLDGILYDLNLVEFEFLAVDKFLKVVNLTSNPGQRVLGLIIMQESKLNLSIGHGWYKHFLFIEES
jgi:hypothetical protein